MTTLGVNVRRPTIMGDAGEFPMIGTDIIYQGAAVGLVAATGLARPLAGGDVFGGFAVTKADNSDGSASDINVNTSLKGKIQLSVAGAVITDKDQPVYATDDDTFVFNPVGGTFIGFVDRFVSAGVVIVAYDAFGYADPYKGWGKREEITGAKTLDIEDNGKLFWVSATAVITMPAVATPVNCMIVNGGAFGGVQVSISPNASDKIQGPDLPGTDNKDLINTLATARRGDFARMITGDANGPIVSQLSGTWATEA